MQATKSPCKGKSFKKPKAFAFAGRYLLVVGNNLIIYIFTEINQVHLVDSHLNMRYSEKRRNIAVTHGLLKRSLARAFSSSLRAPPMAASNLNIPYIWYKAAKRMVCMMDKEVRPIYKRCNYYMIRCNCDGLRIDLDMAAAGVAILDDPYLGGDALAHRVGMTDDAHLLALRTLQHGEGVDDGG